MNLIQGDRCIADGVLCLPPYYFAASTQGGLKNFFAAVLKVSRCLCWLLGLV